MKVKLPAQVYLSAISVIAAGSLLTACSSATMNQDEFIDVADEAGFSCIASEPSDDRIDSITTCRNSEDQECQFVVFTSAEYVRGGDLGFYEDGDEITYGDDWIIVGDNKADVDQLAELVTK